MSVPVSIPVLVLLEVHDSASVWPRVVQVQSEPLSLSLSRFILPKVSRNISDQLGEFATHIR